MPQPPYRVFEYSAEAFIDAVSEFSLASAEYLNSKVIKRYFSDYFSSIDIDAKTVVTEYDYVDHDYLADYTGYYARCFKNYKRYCVRLHIFSEAFTGDDLSQTLKDFVANVHLSEKITKSYCGFVVVKPLPRKMFGRTCLKTYSSNDSYDRHYVTARSYDVNLFGIPLKVKNSLAFQEQDSVAAACATSALWSVFQATGRLFQHPIPSPIEITQSATAFLSNESRPIPNKGLNLQQMAHAVRNVGLEAYVKGIDNQDILKAQIYAFIKCGIPITLAIQLFDCSESSINKNGFCVPIGHHAVAITGYNFCNNAATDVSLANNTGTISLRSSKIEKIYVHDDGIGPYARMEFDGVPVKFKSGEDVKERWSLSTSWKGVTGSEPIGSGRALPLNLLFSIPPKIRVAFESIFNIIVAFDQIIRNSIKDTHIEWEIYLTTLIQYKKEALIDASRPSDAREIAVTGKLPRYLWRAVAWSDSKQIFEFLFDATDFEDGALLLEVWAIDEESTRPFVEFSSHVCAPESGCSDEIKAHPVYDIFIRFSKM